MLGPCVSCGSPDHRNKYHPRGTMRSSHVCVSQKPATVFNLNELVVSSLKVGYATCGCLCRLNMHGVLPAPPLSVQAPLVLASSGLAKGKAKGKVAAAANADGDDDEDAAEDVAAAGAPVGANANALKHLRCESPLHVCRNSPAHAAPRMLESFCWTIRRAGWPIKELFVASSCLDLMCTIIP